MTAPRSIRCGSCRQLHASIAQVRACYGAAGQPAYVRELTVRLADVEIPTYTHARRATLTYLTGASNDGARAIGRRNLGVLGQPGNKVHEHRGDYAGGWAADNGCYSKGDTFDVDVWLRWLEQLPREGCLFATAPDVLRWIEIDGKRVPVGDAAATLERSRALLPLIRKLGFPAALVAQDGLEDLEIPWDDFDVLFVGGSTEWKLGAAAERICREARERGKWVHVGRVNSWRRIDQVRDYADSADGTFLAFGPTKNLPQLVSWLDRLDAAALELIAA